MFLISLLSRLPLRVLYAVSYVLSYIVQHLVRYRLSVARSNIDLCFPQLSEKERKKILRDFYLHFTDIIVEAVWFGGCRGNQPRLHRQRIVEFSNPEAINCFHRQGKSVVILTSHMGNWELMGGWAQYNYTDGPLLLDEQNYVVVYKALTNKKWDDFIHRNRTAPLDDPEGYKGYVESLDVLRYILRHRNEPKFYAFNTDQHPYGAAKAIVPVTFLGQQCQSMVAAANIAQRFGFAVVYQRIIQESRGHYVLEYVTITPDASTTTAQEIMDRYYELLTANITEQPSQYLWTHRRFKK